MENIQATYDPSDDEDQEDSQSKVWLKRVAIALALILIIGGIGYGISKLMSGGEPKQKQKTTIKLLDTPPPPPPPPPKEPPKEQPKEQPKEIKIEPKPVETPPTPPAEVLKMEGAAGDGPSPFQAGAVSKDYEKGDVSTKIGGKKGSAGYGFFTSQVDSQIKKALSDDKQLAKEKYRVDVRVVLASDGGIERAELLESTGDTELDSKIKTALLGIRSIGSGLPEGMPRKLVVRIVSENFG